MKPKQVNKSIKVSSETLQELKEIAVFCKEKLYQTVARLSKSEHAKVMAKRK